jgi:HK97 family phage portal protein
MPTYVIRGQEMTASPGWTTNPEPTLYASWEEAMKQAVNSLLFRGELFIYCTGRYASPNGVTPGQVSRWAVVNPDAVGVQVEDGTIVYRLNGSVLGTRYPGQPLGHTEVLHIKYQSWPGYLHGMGPLEWTAANAIGAAAMEAYVANMAQRGGIPWAVLKSKRNLNGDQSKDLQSAWVSASASRSGAPAVLSGDLELEILQLSPRDMALLDLRVFDEQRISSAFGVPPFLVGLPQADGLVYSNAEALFDFHWRSMLRPLAQTFASALSAWALPLGQKLEFDPDRYTQPPLATRASTYSTLFNLLDPATGERAITIPEIRARERWLPGDATTQIELTGV